MPDNETGSNGQGETTWDGAVSRAVEMGYKVIEDQISQGRQFAEQLSRGGFSAGPDDGFGPDLKGDSGAHLLERIMHFYSDMGALCFEMFETVTRNPAFAEILRSGQAMGASMGGAARTAPDASAHADAVAIEIISARPTGARVTLQWLRPPGERALAVAELRSLPPQPDALTGVEFDRAADGWQPVLRIPIPNGQAAGSYSGLVVDGQTNEPCATLLLMIPASNTNGTG